MTCLPSLLRIAILHLAPNKQIFEAKPRYTNTFSYDLYNNGGGFFGDVCPKHPLHVHLFFPFLVLYSYDILYEVGPFLFYLVILRQAYV